MRWCWMTSEEERREVAGRLFKLSGRRDTQGFDCLLAEAVRGYYFCETPCDECHRRLAAEIGVLVEAGDGSDPVPRDLASAWGWTNGSDR